MVNEAEAAVVRRIFRLCADGKGVKAIAKVLNAEAAPSPRPQRGSPKGWASSSVRSVLSRRTYLGEIVYGQTQAQHLGAAEIFERRPESEWLRVPQPAWRIVSDTEWEAAHRRLTATAQTYARANRGNLWGRPATGVEARYLLSGGIARCAVCGSSMIGHRSTRGDVAALAARLEEQEARRAQLTRELAAFEERQKSMRVDPRRIERELRKRLADWRRLLGEHTPIARQMVLKMVDGRLVFTLKPEDG